MFLMSSFQDFNMAASHSVEFHSILYFHRSYPQYCAFALWWTCKKPNAEEEKVPQRFTKHGVWYLVHVHVITIWGICHVLKLKTSINSPSQSSQRYSIFAPFPFCAHALRSAVFVFSSMPHLSILNCRKAAQLGKAAAHASAPAAPNLLSSKKRVSSRVQLGRVLANTWGHHNHGAIKLRQQERVHDESTNLTNEGIKTLFHTMCGKCAGVMFGDSLEIKN